jgi:Caspase domain
VDGTRSALIVASDEYTDPGLRRLRAPASDAQALAAVLRDPGIGGFEVHTLLNEPAHVVNLAVEEFFADRRPGDLLLVHFSGHRVKDEDGELYFAASNTVLGRLGATAVAAEFVSRRMSRSRSRRVVLLLDCCYAGAFERGLATRAGTEMGIGQQFGGRGRAVITASSAMEYAFEAGELTATREAPPSVFTSALVEGLETGDADRDQDGLVGLDELYDYVYDKVRAATPNQTPGKWTFGVEGELYIARRSRPVATPAALPAELQQAIESPLAGIRAGAVQELAGVLRGRHAGMALAARLALEQLTDDDSRSVAAAATAALGTPAPAPAPARPELALSASIIDLGRLPLHSQSPERRVQVGNAGGGDLNARATASASWLKLRQVGDEFVVAADTSAAGEYEGTITVDSDGGTATIRVRARVDPALPVFEAAAPIHPGPVPEAPAAARPASQQDLDLAMVASAAADAISPVTQMSLAPANLAAGQAVAGPDISPAAPADGGSQGTTPPPRDDHPPVAAGRPGPGAGEKTARAPRPRRGGRTIRRRPVWGARSLLGL